MVLIHGHLGRGLKHVRAVLILELRPQRHQEGLRKFGKIRIRAFYGVSPKDEIGRGAKNSDHQGEHDRVPQRQPKANRIKHGPSGEKKALCFAASEGHSPRRPLL